MKTLFVLPDGSELCMDDYVRSSQKEYNREDYLTGFSSRDIEIIDSDTNIGPSFIERNNLTSILRLASIQNEDGESMFPSIQRAVADHLNYRGLPIKLFNKKGKLISLQPHQLDAINHIKYRESLVGKSNVYGLRGSIIKLQMGLGKTLTAIAWSLIAPRPACREQLGDRGFPTLIVASKTVMIEWQTEGFRKFFGDNVKVLYYHKNFISTELYNSITRKNIIKYDFVITTYDVICSSARETNAVDTILEKSLDSKGLPKIIAVHCRKRAQSDKPSAKGCAVLFGTPWERVIADESQRFANPKTIVYRSMMALYGKYKLCLTGTPIRNYDTDIWAQLRWCGYNGVSRSSTWQKSGRAIMKNQRLNDCILSLDVADTEISLPCKLTKTIRPDLGSDERKVYDYALNISRDMCDRMMAMMADFACVLALFTRLRQICIAPYLITAASKREKIRENNSSQHLPELYTGPMSRWVRDKKGTAGIRSSKMQQIIKTIKTIPEQDKIVVFSTFTSCLDLLSDAIVEFIPTYKFAQLDGDTPGDDRKAILEKFKDDPSIRILLMTYKVGSEGLNLSSANHVICIEPWWTYAVTQQAESRCHRPGQTKQVIVYNFITKDTIEESILNFCEKKKEMACKFLGEGRDIKKNPVAIDKRTLMKLLR